MAPPEPPRHATTARPITGATPRSTPSPLIPDHLHPRWRDLPALAWLTVRRLDTKLQAVPVLGRLAACCAVPLMLLTLICAHADRRLAADGRDATIWICPATPEGRRTTTFREIAIVIVAVALLAPILWFALALGSAGHASVPVRTGAWLVVSAIIGGYLLAVFAVNRWRDLTTRTVPQRRRIAQQVNVPLVVAQGFVANPATRRGVTLGRAILTHADHLGVGILAVARDEHLIDGYRANGFILTEPDPTSRLMYRPPHAVRRRRH